MGYSSYSSTRPCKDCGLEIEWRPTNDGRLNKRGQPLQLPYEVANGRQHKCQAYLERTRNEYRRAPNAQKSKGIPCMYNCGKHIMFSDDQVSVNGRPIPLELSGEPHQCPNKPDRRGTGGGGQQGQYPRGTGGPYPSGYRQQQQEQQGRKDDDDDGEYRNQLTLKDDDDR